MKKAVLIALLALFAFSAKAQEVDQFKVTPNGINGYVVKEYPGKTAEQLFKKTKEWAQLNIANASESKQSEIQGKYLKYKMYIPNAIKVVNMAVKKIAWDATLTVEFRFKNEKSRYDISIDSMDGFKWKGGTFTWSFFRKNGKPKRNTEDARNEINKLLNGIVDRVSKYIKDGAAQSGW